LGGFTRDKKKGGLEESKQKRGSIKVTWKKPGNMGQKKRWRQ